MSFYPFDRFRNYEQRNWRETLRGLFYDGSALTRLLLINIAVFLVEWMVECVLSLSGFLFQIPTLKEDGVEWIFNFFACPASFETLLYRPWTLVTSLFLHTNFSHIFFNMLMLLVMGRIFSSYLSDKKLWVTYFLGGISGNLLYMLSYNFFPVFQSVVDNSMALGASGSIMAIMAAITVYRPQHRVSLIFIGSVSMKMLMLVFVIIDILSIDGSNSGGHIAHLGGVLYGVVAALWFLYEGKFRIKWGKSSGEKRKKYATASNFEYNKRPETDEEYNMRKKQQEEYLDFILDKISKNGYPSLTEEEKDFLFHYNKRD